MAWSVDTADPILDADPLRLTPRLSSRRVANHSFIRGVKVSIVPLGHHHLIIARIDFVAIGRQPSQLHRRVITEMTLAVQRTLAGLYRTRIARGKGTWTRGLVTGGGFSTPQATIADRQTRITRLLHETRPALTLRPRVHVITLAIAVLCVQHPAILALQGTIRAVDSRPVSIARAGAVERVESAMSTLATASITSLSSPSFLAHAQAIR